MWNLRDEKDGDRRQKRGVSGVRVKEEEIFQFVSACR